MTRQHSVVRHKANYFFRILEDDYLLMYQTQAEQLDPIKEQEGKKPSASSDCKAMIASILENWMNSKRPTAKCEEDLYVYLTYDEWIAELRGHYKRSTVIQCLKEMGEEGSYTDDNGKIYEGTIIKQHYVQNTFMYLLNLPVVNALIEALPEQSPFDVKPKVSLGRPSLNRSKINHSELNGIKINGLKTDFQSLKIDDGSLKTNGSTYITKITKTNTDYVSADADSAHASQENNGAEVSSETSKQALHIATTDTHTTLLQAEQERENHGHFHHRSVTDVPHNDTVFHQLDTSEHPNRTEITQPQEIGDSHNGHGNANHHGTGDSGSGATLLPLVPVDGDTSAAGTQPAQEVIPIGVDKSQTNGDKSGKGKKPPKPKDETLEKRIDAVYAALDTFKQEVMDDPDTKFRRTKIGNEEITELLVLNPTLLKLRKVFYDMWNEKDQKTGEHFWRKHMSPQNVCKHYEARLLGLEGDEKKASSQHQVKVVSAAVAAGYTDYTNSPPVEYRPLRMPGDRKRA